MADIIKYGRRFPQQYNGKPVSALDIEIFAFKKRLSVEQGGLGAEQHFKNLAKVFVPWFEWNPWAERQLYWAVRKQYIGITGPGSSSKSEFWALWGYIHWIIDPVNTLVLVTSTSVKGAKLRIWGSMSKMQRRNDGIVPGRLVESLNIITLGKEDEIQEYSNKSSISLIAPDKGKEEKAASSMIGLKNQFVLVIADELPDMSPSVIQSCFNLNKNPRFQFVGIGNANSILDPHGRFCEPLHGWNSITVDSDEWETKLGICIHFDGEKTPNMTEKNADGTDRYPYLIGSEQVKIDRENSNNGTTIDYWRFTRGFWCPEGSSQGVYNEMQMSEFRAFEAPQWEGDKIPVAFLDPAYGSGGDRYAMITGHYGRDVKAGKNVMATEDVIDLKEDITSSVPVNYQIARQFRDRCIERGIEPKNAGVDSTAGGGIFIEIVWQEWSKDVQAINFGGEASSRPVSEKDQTLCKDKYIRKITELWFNGREFIRTGQIRGLTRDIAQELIARQYETKAGGKVVVETKREMKTRTGGKSCDHADAWLGMLELCIMRFGARPSGVSEATKVISWNKVVSEIKKKQALPKFKGTKGINARYWGRA